MPKKPCFMLYLAVLAFTLAPADAAEILEGGWYDASSPVPVLHVEGSIEEIARAHGALLARDPKRRETLLHFAGAVQGRLGSNPKLAERPLLRGIAGWFYRNFIRKPMIEHTPDRYRDAYRGFATAAGVTEEQMWDALVLPDAALRSVSLLYKLEEAPVLPPAFGCTSVIWNSGPVSVLHGRNLDYEGVGHWDANPLILHVVPNEGLAHVAVTAMGIHAPGITAFNEAGLTLAIHQLTFDDTQSSGTPLAVISAEVIRNARTIDDAIAIIRGFPRAAGWAYVLSQGRDRAVVESSANEVAIRRSSEPFFFQTNHVSSPALMSRQIFYSPGSWLDSFERADTLSRLAAASEYKGWATPEKMVSLIGNYGKPARVAGGTISKLDNIQSVVMDAAHRRLWVAVGKSGRAPNEGSYVEYRWSDLRSADRPEVTGAEVTVLPEEALGPFGARLRALLRRAQTAERAGVADARNLEEYATRVENAAKNKNPPAGSWAGLYLQVWHGMKTSADPTKLLARVELALKDPDLMNERESSAGRIAPGGRHWRLLGRITRGRLLDLLGRRAEALFEYEVVRRSTAFGRLRKAAAAALREPFSASDAKTLAIDWTGIDLYAY